jgi:hypothetical protein
MEQSCSWEDDSASQEIRCLLWNPKICYPLPLAPIQSQTHPVHTFPPYFPSQMQPIHTFPPYFLKGVWATTNKQIPKFSDK